jgi:hypothetical protein
MSSRNIVISIKSPPNDCFSAVCLLLLEDALAGNSEDDDDEGDKHGKAATADQEKVLIHSHVLCQFECTRGELKEGGEGGTRENTCS